MWRVLDGTVIRLLLFCFIQWTRAVASHVTTEQLAKLLEITLTNASVSWDFSEPTVEKVRVTLYIAYNSAGKVTVVFPSIS